MAKRGVVLGTAAIAAAIIGLWRLSARDGVQVQNELTIAIESTALPSFAPEKLNRDQDGPLLLLLASPLRFGHLPPAFSLAEDLTLNATARTLRIVFRPNLISPAGMPLTAKTYAETLARNLRRMGPTGPAAFMEELEGRNETMPTGILITGPSELTLKWVRLPEPASKLMAFAELPASLFVPESNWSGDAWKSGEMFDSVGPWKIRATTKDSLTLVPARLPGYLSKYARIQVRRMTAEEMKALPADRPTLVYVRDNPGLADGFALKATLAGHATASGGSAGMAANSNSTGYRIYGTSGFRSLTEDGDQALLQLVSDP